MGKVMGQSNLMEPQGYCGVYLGYLGAIQERSRQLEEKKGLRTEPWAMWQIKTWEG